MPKHLTANAVFDGRGVVFIQQGSYFPVFFSGSHTQRLPHSPENKRVVNSLVNSFSVIPSLTGDPVFALQNAANMPGVERVKPAAGGDHFPERRPQLSEFLKRYNFPAE